MANDAKTVQALGIVLIVILGIFMVTSLNRVNAELVKMNQRVDVLVTTTAQNTLGGFQAVNEEGKMQWKFAAAPMATMQACGMAGGACPSSSGGTCPGSAAGGTCSATGAAATPPAAAGTK